MIFCNLEVYPVTDSAISEEFWQKAGTVLKDLPAPLGKLLAEAGYRFYFSRLVIEAYPHLKDKPLINEGAWEHKREELKTWNQIKGTHRAETREIVIPEYYYSLKTGTLEKVRGGDPSQGMYHEIGHAFDYCFGLSQEGFFSKQPIFIEGYVKDQNHFRLLDYFWLNIHLNNSDFSRRELFADLFFAIFHPNRLRAKLLLWRFPNLARQVEAVVAQVFAEGLPETEKDSNCSESKTA